jgi:site-specific recombinase XerD
MTVVQVRARVFSDATGAYTEMPILLSEQGPLLPLIDYLLAHSQDRSPAWMRKVAQATQRLLQFIDANEGALSNPAQLLQAFGRRLYSGTTGDDGIDASGLYWRSMSARTANILLGAIADFSDWLAEHSGAKPLAGVAMSNRHDERMLYAAWEHRRSRAFLGHTWSTVPQKFGGRPAAHTMGRRREAKVGDEEDAVGFPERRFTDLLLQGFVRRGCGHHPDPALRLNLRDCLVTLLMHGAGLRMSECFHLYVHDVRPDPRDHTVALVRIHHPSDGKAPDDWLDERGHPIRGNRAAYLAARYARRPRHQLLGTEAAGWKDPMLDGRHYMQAYWFPTELGRLFLHLWNRYLLQLVQVRRDHPYGFAVLKGKTAGAPLSLEVFKQNHARAVERLGLTVGKLLGTTPHAHRHAYGRRLMRAGIDPILRKKALHHKSLASQAVYTAPDMSEVTRALNAAVTTLDSLGAQGRVVKPVLNLAGMLQFGFEDVDPDGLLSGPAPKLHRRGA